MKNHIRTTSALVLATALAACGGGGGGSASAPPPPSATLTGANMTVAAEDVVSTAFMPAMSSGALTGAQTLDERVLFTYARAQMDKLPGYMANAASGGTLTGVVQTYTMPCSGGGDITLNATVASTTGVVSAGDNMSMTFNNCVETSGTVNGSLSFTFNTMSGDFASNNYNASLTMTFGAFTVTSAQSSASASANGSVTLAINQTALNVFTSSVSTASLSVSGTYGGLTRSRTLSNYTATANRALDNTYGYLTTYTLTGTVNSTGLGSQTVSFSTPTPFVERGNIDLYPSSGVLLITGANNAKLRITAIDNANVTLELDADGNGSYEVGPNTVAWNTLA